MNSIIGQAYSVDADTTIEKILMKTQGELGVSFMLQSSKASWKISEKNISFRTWCHYMYTTFPLEWKGHTVLKKKKANGIYDLELLKKASCDVFLCGR